MSLRETIKSTLKKLSEKSGWPCFAREEYSTILEMVAAHESHSGKFRRQVGGPARGIFQMEPATRKDIWDNFLKYNTKLKQAVLSMGHGPMSDLENDDGYACVMAACLFARFQAKNPVPKDLEGMAAHCKRFYNSMAGKATPEKYLADYNRIMDGTS